MSVGKGIIKHSALLFLARIANPAATIALGLYVARLLGVEAFGQFSFILSYCFLFSVVFSLGLGTVLGRGAVQEPDRTAAYCANASFLGLIAGVPALLIMLILARWLTLNEEGLQALTIMSLSVFPSILIRMWEGVLVALRRNQTILAIEGVEGAVKLVLGFAVLAAGHSIVWLIVVILGARVLSFVFYLWALRDLVSLRGTGVEIGVLNHLLAIMPPFAGLYVLSALFSKVDILMLAGLRTFNEVGIYSAAVKLLDISFLLPTCIVAVIFPILSKYSQQSSRKFAEFSARTIFYSAAVALPVVSTLVYFAPEIIRVVYSEDFDGSVLPFRILIITLGLYMIDQIFAHSLIARNLQKRNLMALASGTVINISLNAIVIPAYGAIGASISTLVSMVALAAMHYFCVASSLYRLRWRTMATVLLVAAAVPTACVLGLANQFPVVLGLPALYLLYGGLVVGGKKMLLATGLPFGSPNEPETVPVG